VYMTNDGRLIFGVHPGGVRTVTSQAGLNDGQWHHVVAMVGSAGQELYVDAKRVGRRTDTTSAEPFSGFWRLAATTSAAGPTARPPPPSAAPWPRPRCTRPRCRPAGSRRTTPRAGGRRARR
jgi:hypothetical protein